MREHMDTNFTAIAGALQSLNVGQKKIFDILNKGGYPNSAE